MTEKKKDIVKIIQMLQRELQNINNDEFELLLKGEAKIEISVKTKLKKKFVKSNVDFELLENELRQIDNREKGLEILESKLKTKEELESFARKIDVPVLKSDKIELLRKRIIESTIGYRLRSNSIQNR